MLEQIIAPAWQAIDLTSPGILVSLIENLSNSHGHHNWNICKFVSKRAFNGQSTNSFYGWGFEQL